MSRLGAGLALVLLALSGACSLLFESVTLSGAEQDAGDGDGAAAVGDFYISPTGDDNLDGTTPDTAFATWPRALGALTPDSTLVVMDGEYNESNSGYPVIDCGGGTTCGGDRCADGAEGSEIRIVAEHDRQAWLQTTGSWIEPAMTIRDCRFWSIHGLRLSGQDDESALIDDGKHIVLVDTGEDISLSDLLVHGSNRYQYGDLLHVRDSTRVLLERFEGYEFHLTAVEIEDSLNVEVRTSLLYGAGHPDLPGGAASDLDCDTRGERGLRFYGCEDSTADNVVVEEVCDGIAITPNYDDAQSRAVVVSGSMVRDARDGAFFVNSTCDAGCPGSGCVEDCDPTNINRDSRIHNSVAYDSQDGLRLHGMQAGVVENFSAINNDVGIDFQLGHDNNDTATPSAEVDHSLVLGGAVGLEIAADFPIDLSFVNLYGQTTTGIREMGSMVTRANMGNADPMLGSCVAYQPAGSPLRMLGVGAHIVDRTTGGGAVVEGPLWRAGGLFPCGADIDGYDQACTTLHERFFVGAAACPLP
jgi:hypothetical protein